MAQKRFTGTFQEFDEYYQQLKVQRVSPQTHMTVVLELEESEVIQAESSFSDIEHPDNHDWLLEKIMKADKSIKSGKGKTRTKEYFSQQRGQLRKAFISQ